MFRLTERVSALIGEERQNLKDLGRLYDCRCCGKEDGSLYRVLDTVWEIANLDPKAGHVCMSCLDVRLQIYRGDGITLEDLNKHKVNNVMLFEIREFGDSHED